MSVAENPVTEHVPHNPQQQFAIQSVIGGLVLLVGLGLVFAGLPYAWTQYWDPFWTQSLGFEKNDFLSGALLILVDLVAIGGLLYGAYVLLQAQTLPGLRAGMFSAAVSIFAILWIGVWIGGLMEHQFDDNPTLGYIVLAVIMGALFAGVGYLFLMAPGCLSFMEALEHQGWFHGTSYKGNQGVRVRRGTIMGILSVGVCGIITLVSHRFFGSDRVGSATLSNDWIWTIPYTAQLTYVPLMYKIHLLMPLLAGVFMFWFAWRVVNIPAFADFLIATEAEMNKVSWTTRKRLVQDTIVVLVTVFLFTGFLFVVDVIWIKVLSMPGIQVLIIDPKQAQEEQRKTAEW